MASQILASAFTVIQYNVGGAQSLTAAVKPGWLISGNLLYFPNVSGGTATANFQYFKGSTPHGSATLDITAQVPASDSITVPEGVDLVVMTFAEVSMPAGTLTITLTNPDG